ncbi:MAG: ABC transporter substrate-binding protein, partial [Acetobacteraceae bacterium]
RATPGIAQQVTPTRGGTLRTIINPEPPTLNLGFSQLEPMRTVGGKIYQSLLRYTFDLKPYPCLAKSWTISPDKLTYTFVLQDKVTWHDGAPFSADDVVFTAGTFLPKTSARWRPVYEHIDAVTALDPHTVQFKLKQPFGAFISCFFNVNCTLMPKHIYDVSTDYLNNPNNNNPIGTGPFKLKEWRRGSFIHLVRHDGYFEPGKPYLDEIIYEVVPDSAQRAAAIETGQVDLVQKNDIEYFDVPRLHKHKELVFTTKGNEVESPVSWLDINLRLPKFQDKRFRKAMMHALNRQFIVDRLYFGLGKVANGPIASTTKYHDDKALVKYPYDPKQAIALMDEMGLKPDSNGIRQHVKVLALPYGEVWDRQAELVKQNFAKVGIQVTLVNTDTAGYLQRDSNWDYELAFDFIGQFIDPAIGVARSYLSSNIRKGVFATDVEGYVNHDVDDLFHRAETAPSDEEAQKLYSQIQHIISDEVPVLYLTELEWPKFYTDKLHDVIVDGDGPSGDFSRAWKST